MKTLHRQIMLLLLVAGLLPLFAQQQEKLTVEWIYNRANFRTLRLPTTAWLNNGKALWFDPQKPYEEQRLEIFDPKSGKTKPFFDQEKALTSLKKILGEEDTPERLNWPQAIDLNGKYLLYKFQGDLFLLDVKKAAFRRLTENDELEKNVRFSPDGEKLAFVRHNDLYVYDIKADREIRLTFDGSDTILNGTLSWVYWEEIFGRNDIAYWWSGDSRSIAFLRTDDSPVSLMYYSDVQPATPRVIKQRYPKAGQANPRVKVGIVDIATRNTIWAGIDTTSYEYIVRVKWLPDPKWVSVQTLDRPQTHLKLYLVNRETGQARHVFTETDSAWVEVSDDLYFLKDGKHFIWASARTGYNHLYLFDLEGNLINPITRGEWQLRSSRMGIFWVESAVCAVDEKNQWVYFTALEKSSVERHLYRAHFDGSGFERLSREDGTHRISFSPDAQYYFDTHSSISSLPVFSLHRADGKQIKVLARATSEALEKFNLQYPEIFTVKARDGFPMPASLLKPAKLEPGKKYPVIVNVYGGPAAPTVVNAWRSSILFDNILLQNGYLVFRVDNRSASGIAKKYTNQTLYHLMSDLELNDLLDGIKWLKSQPFVDSTRIGIWGWSGGGMHTLLAMTRSKAFKAGIAVAPVSDWHFYDTKYTEAVMKTPQVNPEGYEKTSLLNYAKDLHGRLMIVHGTYDDNVHIQNTYAFIDKLIENDIPFDILVFPMRKHGIGDFPARIFLFNRMLDFWKKNL